MTDNLTVGGNYCFTDAEYNEELVEPVTGTRGLVDGNNATTPASIFTVAERNLLIDGQPLPRVPKHKGTGWAELWTEPANSQPAVLTSGATNSMIKPNS